MVNLSNLINFVKTVSIFGLSVIGIHAASPASAESITVFFDDFDGGQTLAAGVTAAIGGPGGIEPGQGYNTNAATSAAGFSGNLYRQSSATRTNFTLSNLPEHSSIDISFLAAAMDSWDYHVDWGLDFFQVYLDDALVLSFMPVLISDGGTDGAVNQSHLIAFDDLGFNPLWNDAAFDFTNFAPLKGLAHIASTATIGFAMSETQGMDDESLGLDNLKITTNWGGGPGAIASNLLANAVPEPSILTLFGVGLLLLANARRAARRAFRRRSEAVLRL